MKANEFYEPGLENLKTSNFKDSKIMFNEKTNKINKFDDVYNYRSNPENIAMTNEFYEQSKTPSNSNYIREENLKSSNFKDSKVMFNDKTNQFNKVDEVYNYKSRTKEFFEPIKTTSTSNSNYFHEDNLKTSNFKDSKVMFHEKTNNLFDERNPNYNYNYKSKANDFNDGSYPTSILKSKPSEIIAKNQEIPKYTDSVTNNQWEPPSFLKVFP